MVWRRFLVSCNESDEKNRKPEGSWREAFLCGTAFESATLAFRESAPNAKTFVMGESVFKTLLPDLTGETDALSLTGRTAFFREECFGIGLGTERSFLP
jgi:hypothetical protein